jgi:hypothetical protein
MIVGEVIAMVKKNWSGSEAWGDSGKQQQVRKNSRDSGPGKGAAFEPLSSLSPVTNPRLFRG